MCKTVFLIAASPFVPTRCALKLCAHSSTPNLSVMTEFLCVVSINANTSRTGGTVSTTRQTVAAENSEH